MLHFKAFRADLQLFADGGDGGAGAGASASSPAVSDGGAITGDTAADAGRQRLLDLGVPESKIRKNRTYSVPAQQAQQQNSTATQPMEATNNGSQPAQAQKRMSWEEIMKDPEYNKRMQETVAGRLRSAKDAEAKLNAMQPSIELIATKHGFDPENLDYAALNKAIVDDDQYYEDKALEMGVSIETAKRIDQSERQQKIQQRQQQDALEQQRLDQHVRKVIQQADELKQIFPNFDLMEELKNPVFKRLTSLGSGLSVSDAYYAIHHDEIQQASMQVAAQQTARRISSAVSANQLRPQESGASGTAASIQSFDYSKASKAQRDSLKRRIASGERIIPGHEFG